MKRGKNEKYNLTIPQAVLPLPDKTAGGILIMYAYPAWHDQLCFLYCFPFHRLG